MNGTPFLIVAALLDVWSNVLLKQADGFRHWKPFVLAMVLVVGAFGMLGLALKTVPLATAYATWGAFGLVLTALLSRKLDGTRLTPTAWAGVLLIVVCVLVLHSPA